MTSGPPANPPVVPSDGTTDLGANFRAAMRRLASAVGVLTVRGPDGPIGMAATSITSLTMDPPALLVCVNRKAALHACMEKDALFCVNLLSRHQSAISAAFGGGVAHEDRFRQGRWHSEADGLPRLEDAQAIMICRIEKIVPYGTHSIVIGAVNEAQVSGAIAPLIYQDGTYL